MYEYDSDGNITSITDGKGNENNCISEAIIFRT